MSIVQSFFTLLVFLFCLNNSLAGQDITVCSTCEVQTIKQALNQIESGQTIYIQSGDYYIDNLIIDKSITLSGEGLPNVLSKTGDEIITIMADSVTIEGIRFSGVQSSYLKERSAIRIKKKKNFIIQNNVIEDCFFAIYIERGKHGKVLNNSIKGNASAEASSGNGIHAWYCDDILIANNQIEQHRDGIYFEFVDNSLIKDNVSQHNTRYGLHFMFSNHDNYINNQFIKNGVGVAVMFSSDIIMKNNRFAYNWGQASYGLLLKEINDAMIEGNVFEENTLGVFVEGSNRITYTHNRFSRNGWAINLSGGCEYNEIIENNFLNNSLELIIGSQLSSNRFNNNYWSSYSGYDLDKDGIGDVPHYPVKLYSYIISRTPESIVLMRSLFVNLINFSEKVNPMFTPKNVLDNEPLMKMVDDTL